MQKTSNPDNEQFLNKTFYTSTSLVLLKPQIVFHWRVYIDFTRQHLSGFERQSEQKYI